MTRPAGVASTVATARQILRSTQCLKSSIADAISAGEYATKSSFFETGMVFCSKCGWIKIDELGSPGDVAGGSSLCGSFLDLRCAVLANMNRSLLLLVEACI